MWKVLMFGDEVRFFVFGGKYVFNYLFWFWFIYFNFCSC